MGILIQLGILAKFETYSLDDGRLLSPHDIPYFSENESVGNEESYKLLIIIYGTSRRRGRVGEILN